MVEMRLSIRLSDSLYVCRETQYTFVRLTIRLSNLALLLSILIYRGVCPKFVGSLFHALSHAFVFGEPSPPQFADGLCVQSVDFTNIPEQDVDFLLGAPNYNNTVLVVDLEHRIDSLVVFRGMNAFVP